MISYQHHRPYFFTMPDRSDPLVVASVLIQKLAGFELGR